MKKTGFKTIIDCELYNLSPAISLEQKSYYTMARRPLRESLIRFLQPICRPHQGLLKDGQESFSKIYKFFLEDICQNHIKVICSYAQQ